MVWLGHGSNRRELNFPWMAVIAGGGNRGGLWMLHNLWKAYLAYDNLQALNGTFFTQLASALDQMVGVGPSDTPLRKDAQGRYHLENCGSPEYSCDPPYGPACHVHTDCNYGLAQIAWGLQAAEALLQRFNRSDPRASFWHELRSALVFYPNDRATGFWLDANCPFVCPHR